MKKKNEIFFNQAANLLLRPIEGHREAWHVRVHFFFFCNFKFSLSYDQHVQKNCIYTFVILDSSTSTYLSFHCRQAAFIAVFKKLVKAEINTK
jgi:hypothetical protein